MSSLSEREKIIRLNSTSTTNTKIFGQQQTVLSERSIFVLAKKENIFSRPVMLTFNSEIDGINCLLLSQ